MLLPPARLEPPENGGAGVDEVAVTTVQEEDPEGVHPVGKAVPVPKF